MADRASIIGRRFNQSVFRIGGQPWAYSAYYEVTKRSSETLRQASRGKEGMKPTQDEFTNETQPSSWIQIGVSWKIAADAVLTKIQQEGTRTVGIEFGDSFMKI